MSTDRKKSLLLRVRILNSSFLCRVSTYQSEFWGTLFPHIQTPEEISKSVMRCTHALLLSDIRPTFNVGGGEIFSAPLKFNLTSANVTPLCEL